MDAIVRFALSHPDVKIRVVANGRDILNVPRAHNLSDRIALVFGEDFKRHTLDVAGHRDGITLRGVISMPDHTRSNAKGQFYFVNGRFIRDKLLNHSVITTYRRLIEPRRFPYVVLFIEVVPDDVDINVHPAKMEVRFKNPSATYGLVRETLERALSGTPVVVPHIQDPYHESPDTGEYRRRVGETLRQYTLQKGGEKRIFNAVTLPVPQEGVPQPPNGSGDVSGQAPLFEEPPVTKEAVTFSSLTYLGQVAATYLVFSSETALILVDQHAAHERVLFEKLKESRGGETAAQGLLIPEVVTLRPGRFDLLAGLTDMLQEMGLGVETYGENTVIVKQVPAFLSGSNLEELLSDIVEELEDTGKTHQLDEARDTILTLMACKGAVKADSILTEEEVGMLCRDLDAIPFATTCPHGRPLYTVIALRDLERMFKRR